VVDSQYYALVYFTVTGQIIDEIPLQSIPQWGQIINADNAWRIQTQIGPDDGSSGMTKAHLRGITDGWRHSIAICWGSRAPTDYVCQAGPLTARKQVSEQPPTLQLGGTGFWPLLRKILQLASTWPGVSLTLPGGADTTYTSSLQGIAAAILSNAVGASGRVPLPIDIPAGPFTGTTVESFFGYQLTSAGQRLQELTQEVGGPDILLKPRLTGTGFVRHTALIGNPTLSTSGRPLVFDSPGNITGILPSDDFSNLSTSTFQKGNGVEYATLWARSSDATLTAAGWPTLENVDSSHSGEINQAALQRYADGAQGINGRPISTWAVTARQDDTDYPMGSYDPGAYGLYNVLGHSWLPDGAYSQRILGLQNGTNVGEIVHLLQSST
jgi:hypothetical protein